MRVETGERCPPPDDPLLAGVASALDTAGDWAWIVDAGWRVVYMSHEMRLSFGGSMELVPVNVGEHLFGAAELSSRLAQRFGPNSPEAWRDFFSGVGGMVLADTAGGRDELQALVDPSLRDLVDGLTPNDEAVGSWSTMGGGVGGRFEVRHTAVRIRDDAGTLRGTVLFGKPAAGMSVLATMAFQRDAQHLARMQQVADLVTTLAPPPGIVARTVVSAVESRRPRHRYLVGADALGIAVTNPLVPRQVSDTLTRLVADLRR